MTGNGSTIRLMSDDDWPDVARVYAEGIQTGEATFETSVPTWEDWNASHLTQCRFVADVGDGVDGWAALSPVSSRHVYRGVAEVSVYVGERSRGLGLGPELLATLVADSESEGFWTLQAAIFPENDVSVRLHEQQGFRVVGRRERLGQREGTWRDVVLMERRSGRA